MKSKVVSGIIPILLLASILALGSEIRSVSAPDLSIEAVVTPWGSIAVYHIYPIPWPNMKVYKIAVNVTNQGTADAGSFNVSFSAYWEGEETPEVSQKKTVAGLGQGVTEPVKFGFSPENFGNYTLVMIADCDNDVVELDETNNLKTEWVIATLWFDIDGDRDVDWQDFGDFATAYGSKGPPQKDPPDPNYNPLADQDQDGDVDWEDFGGLATNYGMIV